MSEHWEKYIAKFGTEPSDSGQLLKFTQLKDSVKPLNFKEARDIFENNKTKKSTSNKPETKSDNKASATNNNKPQINNNKPQANNNKPQISDNTSLINNNDNNKDISNEKENNQEEKDIDSGRGGLFAELNKGTNITSGLKKVTSDMKAKNQPDRTGKVPEAPLDSKNDNQALNKKDNKDQVKEKSIKKQGPRLMIEYCSEGVEDLKDAGHKTEVNLYRCANSGFLIPNKIKNVVIDSCNRIQVEIYEVISSIELVNCQNVTLFVKKSAPSITVDKSSQPKLFIYDEALENDPNIITSMVTDMNISVQNGDDWNEMPVPYQFVTKIDKKTKKTTTIPVEHSG